MNQIEKLKECFYPVNVFGQPENKMYRKIHQADLCQEFNAVAVFLSKDSYSPHILSIGEVQKIIDESPKAEDLILTEHEIYKLK